MLLERLGRERLHPAAPRIVDVGFRVVARESA